eukprot:m.187042 g.187042  ORF g.187042 m.187042 type:complete len:2205 (+) comp17514_c0_seq1:52-6666(+)
MARSSTGPAVALLLVCSMAVVSMVAAAPNPCLVNLNNVTVDLHAIDGVFQALDGRENSKYVYHLSLCQPLPNTPLYAQCLKDDKTTSVCQDLQTPVNNSGFPFSLGSYVSTAFVNNNASLGIVLTYKANRTLIKASCNGASRSTIVYLTCGADLGTPVFVEEMANCSYVFEWQTSAACIGKQKPPASPLCQFNDPFTGSVYDLSGLTRHGANWRALDVRPSEQYFYELNVCSPVVDTVTVTGPCDTLPTGVCQEKVGSTSTWSLGKFANPTFENGTLQAVYTGGTYCNTGKVNRSSVVMFQCDPTRGLGVPQFLYEDAPNCRYYFQWISAAACPIGAIGQNCAVYDPPTGSYLDFAGLANQVYIYNQSGGTPQELIVRLAVCSLLPSSDCGANTSVCINANQRAYHVGGPTNAIFREDGVAYMVHNGHTVCRPVTNGPNITYTTYVEFVCDPKDSRFLRPVYQSPDTCTIVMALNTSSACPIKPVECAAFDDVNGRQYDFSTLASARSNYAVFGGPAGQSIIINVCRNIVPTAAGRNCSGSAGGCLVNTTTGKALTFGRPRSPVIINGKPYLNYTDSLTGRKLLVEMVCAPAVAGVGQPVVVSSDASSQTYMAIWATPSACPLQMDVGTPCQITDSVSGHVYDLSILRDSTDYVVAGMAPNAGRIRINMCGPLAAKCGTSNTSAVCLEVGNTSISLGNAGQSLTLTADQNLMLQYTSPLPNCPATKGAYITTIVQFTCPLLEDSYGPSIKLVSNCTYIISWPTYSACYQASCSVAAANGTVYDLSYLSDATLNWEVWVNDATVFEINVCRPVVQDTRMQAAGCPAKAASCKFGTLAGGSPAPGSGVDFGHTAGPTMRNGQLVLSYTGGADCPSAPGIKASTTIQFLCSQDSFYGEPEFLRTTDQCESLFSWSTAFACADQPPPDYVSCYVVDDTTGLTYDLSGLSNVRHNYVATSFNGSRADFQINVCRELVAGTHGCSGAEAACLTNSNLDLGNLVDSPQIDNGQLFLLYSGGGNCSSYLPGASGSSSTRINFVCPYDSTGKPRGGVVGLPQLISVSPSCQFVFVWETSFACPQESFIGSDCTATAIATGGRYDLSALNRATGYTVNGVSFNPCMRVPTCPNNALSCLADKSHVLGTSGSSQLMLLDDTALYLSQSSPERCPNSQYFNYSLGITFNCNETAGQGKPVLSYSDNCYYEFAWDTALACPPSPVVQCVAVDNTTNTVYDLTPLMSRRTNFIAEDTRENGKYIYLINVCGTIVPDTRFPSCGLNSSVCQASLQNNLFTEVSLGTVGQPVFSNGQLYLQYLNGDMCGTKPRSTRINFYCADGASTGTPVFVEEINCMYIFAWYTPYACNPNGASPTPNAVNGSNCRVYDPNKGVVYDLSSLAKQDFTAVSDALGWYSFAVSVCAPLRTKSCGTGAGACQTRTTNATNSVSLGVANANPFLHPGTDRVALRYAGGPPCKTNDSRETLIIFECDNTPSTGLGMPILADQTADCMSVFTWRTNATCAPQRVSVPCIANVFKNGQSVTYDLSKLAGLANNADGVWTAYDPMTGSQYILNVCSQMMGLSSAVPAACVGSTICQVAANGVAKPIGGLGSGPSLVNDALVVRGSLLAGAPGARPAANCTKQYTQILYNCYPGVVGSPVFVSYDGCILLFSWDTYLACAEKPIVSKTPVIADSLTGYNFDLTPLVNQQVKISLPNNAGTLYFSLFSPLQTVSQAPAGCLASGNTAACLAMPNNANLLVASAANYNLTYGDNLLSLQYPSLGANSIIIVLSCDISGTKEVGRTTAKQVAPGNFVVQVPSRFACLRPQAVDCVVSNASTNTLYDLTVLASAAQDWLAVTAPSEPYEYHISVCHSGLGSTTNVSDASTCADAGLCQILARNRNPFNLGATSPPRIQDGQLQLVFRNGQPCGTYHRSSLINMTCGDSKFPGYPLGRPEYLFESPLTCRYNFVWQTPAACPVKQVFSQSCVVTDPLTGAKYDLSPLASRVWNATDRGGQKYSLRLCGSSKVACGSSGAAATICQSATNGAQYSLGAAQNAITVYDGHLFTDVRGGVPCNAGVQRSARIEYVCNPAATSLQNVSITVNEDSCTYSFVVSTSLACPSFAPASTTTTAAPSKSHSSGKKGNAGVIVGVTIVLIVVLLAATFLILKRRGVTVPGAGSFGACCPRRPPASRYAKVSDFYSNNNDDDDGELDATWAE